VLVRSHDGAVDHRVFDVGVGGEMLENPFPDAGLGPTGKPRVNLDRITKPLRQVAPGNPSAIAVEHCFDEQTVVSCRHSDVAFTARQQVLDTIPLVVTKGGAAHRSASQADPLGIAETAAPETPVRPCRADRRALLHFGLNGAAPNRGHALVSARETPATLRTPWPKLLR
jgi:hypothetical protein